MEDTNKLIKFIDQLSEENAKPKLIEQLKALNQLLSDTGDKYNADVLINAVFQRGKIPKIKGLCHQLQ